MHNVYRQYKLQCNFQTKAKLGNGMIYNKEPIGNLLYTRKLKTKLQKGKVLSS